MWLSFVAFNFQFLAATNGVKLEHIHTKPAATSLDQHYSVSALSSVAVNCSCWLPLMMVQAKQGEGFKISKSKKGKITAY